MKIQAQLIYVIKSMGATSAMAMSMMLMNAIRYSFELILYAVVFGCCMGSFVRDAAMLERVCCSRTPLLDVNE